MKQIIRLQRSASEEDGSREDEFVPDHLRSPGPCVHWVTAKNLPPPINTTYYSDNFMNLYFITSSVRKLNFALPTVPPSEPSQDEGTAGPGWKYWRPISTHLGLSCASGRGIPNYIPEWELIQEDRVWYHVDDLKRQYPVTLSSDLQEDQGSVVRFVPYAFIPAERQSWPNGTPAPLNVAELESYLGLLYSVPSDHRLHLGFEKSTLRLKAAGGILKMHLENIRKLFDGWETFKIIDFDEFMNPTVYSRNIPNRQVPDKDWNIRTRPYAQASMPSLLAECFSINISPTPLRLTRSGNCIRQSRLTAKQGYGPWYRIVHCQGLTSRFGKKSLPQFTNIKDVVTLLLEPRFFAQTPGIRNQEMIDYVSEMFLLHLNCHRRYTIYNPYKRRAPFHITWFRIMEERELTTNANWKSGRLYVGTKEQRFEEVAFTVDYFFEQTLNSDWWSRRQSPASYSSFHWTTILLSPQHLDLIHENLHWPPSAILVLIKNALQNAANSYENVCSHFASVLNDQLAIFDLDEHDNLLFDDNTFSRSRCYFWVIDSLEAFKERIADAKKQWEDFWAAREDIFRKHEEGHISRLRSFGVKDPYFAAENRQRHVFPKSYRVDDVVNSINIEVSRLDNSAQVLEGFYKKTQSLRDGLFSASAVAESRAATQLGENIRLLTYVSIFYLPLSYCASLWSLNEQYTVLNFAIVTFFIALATYSLVGNLNHAVLFSKKTVRHIKNPIVERMKRDPDRIWGERGDRFSAFKPVRENVEPSQWHIPQYLCIEILRKFRLLRLSPSKPRPEHEAIKPYEVKPPPFSLDEPIQVLKQVNNLATASGKQTVSSSIISSVKQKFAPKGPGITRYLERRGHWLVLKQPAKTVREDAAKEV
ncbi:hypothetical protein I7I48_01338 [Histoplasma ohiense]|nr:hypothetical protein I7I48_01338 [Histoplasma ohiense (nom. inval.)]